MIGFMEVLKLFTLELMDVMEVFMVAKPAVVPPVTSVSRIVERSVVAVLTCLNQRYVLVVVLHRGKQLGQLCVEHDGVVQGVGTCAELRRVASQDSRVRR